jgi:hypothetical protein
VTPNQPHHNRTSSVVDPNLVEIKDENDVDEKAEAVVGENKGDEKVLVAVNENEIDWFAYYLAVSPLLYSSEHPSMLKPFSA